MTDEQLGRYFKLSEFTESDTATRLGLDNTPGPEALATLRNVLVPAMDQVRDILGWGVIIRSGYRSRNVNAAVRGSPTSQHLTGHACDFVSPAFGTPLEICRRLVQEMAVLRFDQLIFEGTWVHISFSTRQRNEVLTAHFSRAGVTYTPGLSA